MKLSDSLLPEFDHECATTRLTLERIPYETFDWKPHDKSFTMGHLATHLANIPSWAALTMEQDELEGGSIEPPTLPASTDELLERFDADVRAGRDAIASAEDPRFFGQWTFLKEGKPVVSMPRIAVLRSFVMNHLIHHRAQLGIYLRMNDVPLPQTYGPSADETEM